MKFCPFCGTPVQSTWSHCRNCGKEQPNDFVAANQERNEVPQPQPILNAPGQSYVPFQNQKSQGVAITLAIFFSYWSWLYTYKVDAAKFWVGLLSTTAIGFIYGYNTVPTLKSYNPSTAANLLVWVWVISGLVYLVSFINALTKDFSEVNKAYDPRFATSGGVVSSSAADSRQVSARFSAERIAKKEETRPSTPGVWCNGCLTWSSPFDKKGEQVKYCPECGSGPTFLDFD